MQQIHYIALSVYPLPHCLLTWVVPVCAGEVVTMSTVCTTTPAVIHNNSVLHWAVWASEKVIG